METATNATRFEANGKTYVLKYTIERVNMYEDAYGSLGRLLYTGDVFLKFSQLCDLMACAVKEEGGDYVNPQVAHEMAVKVIEENGYYETIMAVFTQLKDDCGFLFADFNEAMMQPNGSLT